MVAGIPGVSPASICLKRSSDRCYLLDGVFKIRTGCGVIELSLKTIPLYTFRLIAPRGPVKPLNLGWDIRDRWDIRSELMEAGSDVCLCESAMTLRIAMEMTGGEVRKG